MGNYHARFLGGKEAERPLTYPVQPSVIATRSRRMIEYLYIDIPRLDRYYEQISSPVEYDKC
jgi:hypothetical protein